MYNKIILSLLINSFIFSQSIFFSEYAEGSSNNKYLEIYNNTDQTIDLSQYAFPNSNNGADIDGTYDYWNVFDGLNQDNSAPVSGSTLVNPGEVYVVCHQSSDDFILSECDQYHTYLSNGDDGFCLVFGSEGDFTILDCIGNWSSTDPGNGWDVAGVSDGTKEHTLVRKANVQNGNQGDWTSSAGTNSDDSEWIVLAQNTWDYLGFHPHEDLDGGMSDDGGSTGGGDVEICDDGIDNDGDTFIDCDDFDCPPCEGGEICDNEIDDDGDGYVDCNDFDCPPCEGGEGSCAEYGCVDYTPSNACQCNDLCADFGNCCDDYEELCASEDSGGSTGGGDVEICDDGIDNDGDTFIDCYDFDCPPCEGGEICDNEIDDDGDGYVDCNDFDCTGDVACPAEICNDGIDNDGDGFADCDDWDCNGGPDGDWYIDPSCEGNDSGGGDGGTDPVDADAIFFSEYAEGSSNNKYLEIYNADDHIVDLQMYSISTCANGCNDGVSWDYPSNVEFDIGASINPGDVYVVCNGSADATILDECDQTFTYLSNGDDVMGLTQLSTGGTVDIIGEIGDDPGDGWDVAGVNNATKDHTLVRKQNVSFGNSDWSSSAGTNVDNSEWIVYDQNTWDNLGFHESGPVSGCMDETAYNYNPDAVIDAQDTCIYLSYVTIQEIQGEIASSPYENMPVSTQGLVTAVNSNGFYMQNGSGQWSGIWVYNNGLDLSLQEGMLVEAIGYVLEFYSLTEIELDQVNIINSEATSLNSYSATTGELSDESFESVYIQISSAECTALENEYGDWILNDGSGDILVGDDFIDFEPALGTSYNVIGILDYEFNEYKIQPLTIEIDYPEGAPIAIAGEDQFVDEGQQVTLDGTQSFDNDGSIIGYEWIQTSGVAVDLGNYENDIVTFTAPNQFAVLEFSLIVLDNDFNFSYPDYITITVGNQSIYDIQYSTEEVGNGECYPSSFVGSTINVTGTVTAVKSFSSYPNFFIQDPDFDEWSGVYVYVNESEPFNIGDKLNFSAEVDEYYGVTELKNLENVQLLSSDNEINPVSISTGSLGLECGDGEKYEGMLVEFSNVVVDSIDVTYNSIYVNDGSGIAKLDDYYFNFDADGDDNPDYWPDVSVGDTIDSAIGAVHYYFEEYVVYPRDITDLGGSSGNTSENCSNGIDDDGDGYVDCEDWSCNGEGPDGGDIDPACEGSDDGGSGECDDSNFADLFFSEYAEGSSNNKYLEIYNNSDDSINLCGYAFPNSNNGATVDGEYDYWNTFDDGESIAAGDVYVICHGSSDELIQPECDQFHTYLSNGNDGFCLTFGNENNFQILDCIGDWSESDPGEGWDVAGVSEATKDHTLVRKSSVISGNEGNWTSSAGTNEDDSEWIVLESDDWTYLGFHDIDNSGSDGGDDCVASGDINDDGNINVVDVVQVVNNVLNLVEFDDDQFCAADLNSDGAINVVDVVQLVNIILGIN